ncbi:hypothetical protein PISL3812_04090 [Talaromyces islandicus]|uniref:Uncharacterized protein n=1 Tax=Talaromyces islandicus TaxID=28573 RepID=A0A0U1LV37_TALIS|nr:hypothetical protein PISL3812_04090 [Talaromyces islandicus]
MSLSSVTSAVGTTTGTAVSPTQTSCVLTYEIPVKDAACAAVHSDTSDKVMKQCCGVADVVSIDGGCASYCLAQGQDVGDLSKCLYSNGFTGNSVYCNNAQTATATAPVSTTTGSASTATGTGTASTSGTGTATGTGATSSSTTGAAVPVAKVSTGGVGVLALLFCSALFGSMA